MSSHHDVKLDPSERTALQTSARGVMGMGAIVGIVSLAIAIGVSFVSEENAGARFWFAYLTAFAFWLSISLGGLFFVLITHVAHTGATVVVRRLGELVAANVIILALFAVPILYAAWTTHLYEWTHPPEGDYVVAGKAAYLNLPFFTARWIVYFLVWIGLGLFYLRTSRLQDDTGDAALTLRMQKLAPVGLLLFAVTGTFASFDLIKSLTPHWFSTMFGVYYFAGAVVGFYATQTLLMRWMQGKGVAPSAINHNHYHDAGKMLFAFVVFWAYIAYSQYMLIWYASIPEETAWFVQHGASTDPRHVSIWSYVIIGLLFGHFIIPLLGMMSRSVKRKRNLLCAWAVWLLVMHYIDLLWVVRPSLADHGDVLPVESLEVVQWIGCALGMGGIWIATLAWLAGAKPLIPVKDPRLSESLAFENI